jgi:hypothetical protein
LFMYYGLRFFQKYKLIMVSGWFVRVLKSLKLKLIP